MLGELRTRPLFRCPRCGFGLELDGRRSCSNCGRPFSDAEGILDFVEQRRGDPEQAHYDALYNSGAASCGDLAGLSQLWQSRYYPMNSTVLERVGDVGGRVVVLLGNGTSSKELWFLLQEPELLVFSDLSSAAVREVRKRYSLARSKNVLFAAIDATELPFADDSVDVLYGYAFVHHLPDVDAFLAEAVRVLRPGGRCVFMDDAYSPLWHLAKRTALRPLMAYFHRIQKPSPEDLRCTLAGGFREPRLAQRIRELGCEPWFFRSGFVHYLVTRASEGLPPHRLWRALVGSESVLDALVRLDERLGQFRAVRRNQIRLVWGLDKPWDRRIED